MSTFFVRLFNCGEEYDCELLTRPQFRDLAGQAELVVQDVMVRALQFYGRNEMSGPLGKLIAAFPDWLAALVAGLWFIPSLIFICSRLRGGGGGGPERTPETVLPS